MQQRTLDLGYISGLDSDIGEAKATNLLSRNVQGELTLPDLLHLPSVERQMLRTTISLRLIICILLVLLT